MSDSTATPTPTGVPTETPTPEPTATGQASGGVMLAAPMLIPGSAPKIAPLGVPMTTTHRVISHSHDRLYRLTSAQYSTGEFYRYSYDAVGNRLSLVTSNGSTSYEYDAGFSKQ